MKQKIIPIKKSQWFGLTFTSLKQMLPRSIGFSFFKAWQWLTIFGVLLNERYNVNAFGAYIGEFYPLTHMLATVVLFVLLGIILPMKSLPLSAHRSIYVAAALLAGVGTIVATQSSGLLLLVIMGPILTGFGEALIVLMCGEYCSSIGIRQTGLFLLMSYLLAVGLFFIVVSVPETIIPFLMSFYPIIAVVSLLSNKKAVVYYGKAVAKTAERRVLPVIKHSELWKIFLSLAVLSFSVNFARYSMESIGLMPLRNYPILMAAHATAAVLAFVGALLSKKKNAPVITVNLVILIVAIGIALIPFIDSSQGFFVSFILTSGKTYLVIVSWIIFASITHSLRIPSIKVFGWGSALTIGGNFLGAFVGSFVVSAIFTNETPLMAITLVNMILLIASAAFLSNGYTTVQKLGVSMQTSGLVMRPLDIIAQKYALTPREKEITALLVQGRSLPHIEKELNISHGTANTHVHNIYQKVGVRFRQELLDVFQSFEHELR